MTSERKVLLTERWLLVVLIYYERKVLLTGGDEQGKLQLSQEWVLSHSVKQR
jgi:hypothetical protein